MLELPIKIDSELVLLLLLLKLLFHVMSSTWNIFGEKNSLSPVCCNVFECMSGAERSPDPTNGHGVYWYISGLNLA